MDCDARWVDLGSRALTLRGVKPRSNGVGPPSLIMALASNTAARPDGRVSYMPPAAPSLPAPPLLFTSVRVAATRAHRNNADDSIRAQQATVIASRHERASPAPGPNFANSAS